jgi:hypothetical protein
MGKIAARVSVVEPVVMTKRELIDRIMQLNKTARREFLQCFTENELTDYLRQLETVQPYARMVVEAEVSLA